MAGSNLGPGIHTVPVNTGWENQQNGIVLSRHQKKERAVVAGRRMANRLKTELTVHGRDGSVLQTTAYAMPISPALK